MIFGRNIQKSLESFKSDTENNANFDAVSSKHGNFDAVQWRRQNFDQKSVWM